MIFWKKKEEMDTGARGEEIAASFLMEKGYKIIKRNYKNFKGKQLGEIDIIAEKNKEIIFVEVKTRNLEKYQETLPEENITSQKLRKMSKIAVSYIKSNNLWDCPYHFDAISVWLSRDLKKYKIKHIESIFI
jgi:putative endonuclease